MLLKLLLGGMIAGAIGVRWMRRKRAAEERERQRDLDRFGLRELDDRLKQAAITDRLPIGTDPRWFVVDTMRTMLRELEAAPPNEQQAALVQPSSVIEHLACEELVRMKLMVPGADGATYVFQRRLRARQPA